MNKSVLSIVVVVAAVLLFLVLRQGGREERISVPVSAPAAVPTEREDANLAHADRRTVEPARSTEPEVEGVELVFKVLREQRRALADARVTVRWAGGVASGVSGGDGLVELVGIPADEVEVEVSCDGYLSEKWRTDASLKASTVREVRLFSGAFESIIEQLEGRADEKESGELALCLTSPLGVVPDADRYVLAKGVPGRTPVAFGADGCLTIDACPEGPLRFEILTPSGDTIAGTTNLLAAEEWRFEIPLEGLSSVLVDFEVPGHVAAELRLLVEYAVSPGFYLQHARVLKNLDPVRLEGIPGGSVFARLTEVGGEQLGGVGGEFRDGIDQLELTIEITGDGYEVFLVDIAGVPLQQAIFYVGPEGGAVYGRAYVSDSDGTCMLNGLPDGELWGMLKDSSGVRPGVRIEGPGQVVTLDASGALEVRLTGPEGEPVQGVDCLLVDPKVWQVIAVSRVSDANGVVRWASLHEGDYLVQVRGPGWKAQDEPVRVGGETLVPLALRRE